MAFQDDFMFLSHLHPTPQIFWIRYWYHLFILQDELETKIPGVMQFGLLFEKTAEVATLEEQPTYVSFSHRLLQDYAAAYFMARTVERAQNPNVRLS